MMKMIPVNNSNTFENHCAKCCASCSFCMYEIYNDDLMVDEDGVKSMICPSDLMFVCQKYNKKVEGLMEYCEDWK